MSTRTVVVWVVLAVLLGAATFVVLRSTRSPGGAGQAAAAPGARILDFSPASVQRIVVRHADGTIDELDRKPAPPDSPFGPDADWWLTTRRPSKGAEQPVPPTLAAWPLSTPSVQGLLRKLADCQSVGEAPREAALGERPTTVEIGLHDGSMRTLRLAERTLAGTGLIEVTSSRPSAASSSAIPSTTTRALVNDEFHRVFTNPGPRAWRERAIFAGISADAARVRLETPRQRLALGRIEGRWSLREPVPAPADPGAIQRLLASLARVEVEDFLDDVPPNAATGLENPTARITLEADRRSAASATSEPTTTVASLEVVIGGGADSSGRRVFASVNDMRLVLLDARALGTLSLDPAAFLWPAPARLPAADIGAIAITPNAPGTEPASAATPVGAMTLKRSLARWVQIEPNGTERLLAEQELRDAENLALFLTGEDRPAAPPSPGQPPVPTIAIDPPPSYRPLARIDLRSLGDTPLESIETGTPTDGPAASTTLTFRTGQVYRTYPLNRVPAILARLASPRPAAQPDDRAVAEEPVK